MASRNGNIQYAAGEKARVKAMPMGARGLWRAQPPALQQAMEAKLE